MGLSTNKVSGGVDAEQEESVLEPVAWLLQVLREEVVDVGGLVGLMRFDPLGDVAVLAVAADVGLALHPLDVLFQVLLGLGEVFTAHAMKFVKRLVVVETLTLHRRT